MHIFRQRTETIKTAFKDKAQIVQLLQQGPGDAAGNEDRSVDLGTQHHRLKGQESEQAPGLGDGQGSLACCSPWGRKESDMTERLKEPQKDHGRRATDSLRDQVLPKLCRSGCLNHAFL